MGDVCSSFNFNWPKSFLDGEQDMLYERTGNNQEFLYMIKPGQNISEGLREANRFPHIITLWKIMTRN